MHSLWAIIIGGKIKVFELEPAGRETAVREDSLLSRVGAEPLKKRMKCPQ